MRKISQKNIFYEIFEKFKLNFNTIIKKKVNEENFKYGLRHALKKLFILRSRLATNILVANFFVLDTLCIQDTL